MTRAGIEPATFRFVAQHLNYCATAVPSRYECQEYFFGVKGGRCVGMTTLTPSCTEYLEILELQPPGTLRGRLGLYKGFFFYLFTQYYYERARACVKYFSRNNERRAAGRNHTHFERHK